MRIGAEKIDHAVIGSSVYPRMGLLILYHFQKRAFAQTGPPIV